MEKMKRVLSFILFFLPSAVELQMKTKKRKESCSLDMSIIYSCLIINLNLGLNTFQNGWSFLKSSILV